MPEFRREPLTGRIVIVAEERASRPQQFDIESSSEISVCPFCEGHESTTPHELYAVRAGDSEQDKPGWTARVVPNLYPALTPSGINADFSPFEPFTQQEPTAEFSLQQSATGLGHHEVLIETNRHLLCVSEMTEAEVVGMFRLYRHRLQTHRQDPRWRYPMLFKNVGAAAGASLPHSHSQLLTLPFVPASIADELRQLGAYRSSQHSCFRCDEVRHEISAKARLALETEHFVTICPFVSRLPGETMIIPKEHYADFDALPEPLLDEAARLLRQTITKLKQAVSWMPCSLSYNIILRTAPWSCSENVENYHTYLVILPSLARAAGFEWGTGLHINPISPEKAAAMLRNA